MVLIKGVLTMLSEHLTHLCSYIPIEFSSVVIYAKYSVILLILFAVAFPYWRSRRRMVRLIDQIPGPPVEPWFPFLGHALLVLHLDRANFQYGTYSRKFALYSQYLKLILTIDFVTFSGLSDGGISESNLSTGRHL